MGRPLVFFCRGAQWKRGSIHRRRNRRGGTNNNAETRTTRQRRKRDPKRNKGMTAQGRNREIKSKRERPIGATPGVFPAGVPHGGEGEDTYRETGGGRNAQVRNKDGRTEEEEYTNR